MFIFARDFITIHKMKRKLTILATIVSAIYSVSMSAQEPQMLPLDSEVRIGQLDNGLTYYLRHNNWPEATTTIQLEQRVGAIQEEESQLGLAHFLEHMCFNGSEHFPGNASVAFCQRYGVAFDAETRTDRTTYHLDNIPNSVGSAVLDSCLLLVADWSHGLTLDAREINNERDVIHGEYRYRNQGEMRLYMTDMPRLFPGRYGQRNPIGTMAVVDNFAHQELIDYYHRWYNPQNQALIIVGDIDVDAYEQKVRTLFAPITSHPDAGVVEEYHLADHDQVIYSLLHDKDLDASYLEYSINLPEPPGVMKATTDAEVMNYVLSVAANVLNLRLVDLSIDADCPWYQAEAGMGCFISDKFKQLNIKAYPKMGQASNAYALMLTELRRLVEYGILQSVYNRFLEAYSGMIDNRERQKDKIDNTVLAQKYQRHFSYGYGAMSSEHEISLLRQFAQMLPLEAINQLMKQFICTTGQNSTLKCWEKEQDGAAYITQPQLEEAFAAVQRAQIEAPVDNSFTQPLMSQLPTPGSIVSEETEKFGFTHLTLSNGVSVHIRQTDVSPNEIQLYASAQAGNQQFDDQEFANFEAANQLPFSKGGWSDLQVRQLLQSKIVASQLGMNDDFHYFAGMSSTTDLESLMQIMYLSFTDLGRDDDRYRQVIEQARMMLGNRKSNIEAIFADSLSATLYCHDARHRSVEVGDLDQIDYNRVLQMVQTPMQNAANFEFIISGDFDEAALRQYLCLYVASLPSRGKADDFRTLPVKRPEQPTVCDFKVAMTEPKVLSQTCWSNSTMTIRPEDGLMADLVANILSNRHFQILREEMNACYTPGVVSEMDLTTMNHHLTLIASHSGFDPAVADQALAYTERSIIDLSQQCTTEDLGKAQEALLNALDEGRKTQVQFYMTALNQWLRFGYDRISIAEEFVRKQTLASVQSWLQTFLKDAVETQVIARPE